MTYELVVRSRRRFAFIPHDLRYFQDHFVCQPMSTDWEVPPVQVIGKSYKSADFVSWMQRAPVVSPRAKAALANVRSGLIEFLPFHPIKGVEHFAINVLSLDDRKPIHKTHPQSVIFVNDDFGRILRDNALSGVELADPTDEISRRSSAASM